MEDLAEHYASADAFVFPSLTDTFGNVLLEALACGVPVAAYNVMGPKDVVANGSVGVLGDDLRSRRWAVPLNSIGKAAALMPNCSLDRMRAALF